MTGRRKRVDRTGSAPKRRSANPGSAQPGNAMRRAIGVHLPRPDLVVDDSPPCYLCQQPIHLGHECHREDHGARLRRLVAEVAADLDIRYGLSPVDAIWVAEGAADRIRREAERVKREGRGR